MIQTYRVPALPFSVSKGFLAYFLALMAGAASAEENASNPLASVNNVDVRWQYTSNDPLDRHDVFIDGSHMITPKVKLKYELHYNVTDATGPGYPQRSTKGLAGVLGCGGRIRRWDE